MAPDSQAEEPTIKDKARFVAPRILISAPADHLAPLDECLDRVEGAIRPQIEAFRENFKSAISVATFPYTTVLANTHRQLFERIFTAERIRKLSEQLAAENPDKDAFTLASEKFVARLATDTTQAEIAEQIITRIFRDLSDENYASSAAEILRQAVVMIWGAFETLAADSIRAHLNRVPQAALQIVKHESTKKYLSQKSISIETLLEYEFDLSGSMGEVLLADRHLDSLPMIREFFRVLFPLATQLHEKLSSSELWLLWQRRHLIVHKRGIVDKNYVTNTSDEPAVGSKLEISSNYVEDTFRSVRDIAIETANVLSVNSI